MWFYSTRGSQTSHMLNLDDHKSIQKDEAMKTSVSVF